MAAEERLATEQGQTVELKIYYSGYPVPNASHITWQRPDSSIITGNEPGVTFQDERRTLVLANVQADQAGVYRSSVSIAISQTSASASVNIQLDVYGK